MIMWKPIKDAPWNEVIILKGDSGTYKFPYFIILGYRDYNSYGDSWLNINGDMLSDYGYTPTEFKYINELESQLPKYEVYEYSGKILCQQ